VRAQFAEQLSLPATALVQGQRLIRRHGFVPEDQAIYSGLVKPKEANHDADLYRMYHKAADEIESKDGKVLRVQLDYELKEKLHQRLGRAQARGQAETQRFKETFTSDLNLPVVRGKVSFPDLRIEYATQENEIARLDLELATRHYHSGHIAEKARTGFQLYARPQDTAGTRGSPLSPLADRYLMGHRVSSTLVFIQFRLVPL